MNSGTLEFGHFLFIIMIGLLTEKRTQAADTTYMADALRNYFSKTRHHEVDQVYKNRSMNFIHDEFKRFGLETMYHDFQDLRVSDTVVYDNRPINEGDLIHSEEAFQKHAYSNILKISPQKAESFQLNFTNVVGILKGERFGDISDRILGVGAHFDTVNTTAGVDDNGAGCAAMLEVARQLTEMNVKRQNTIIFVSFDVEERTTFASGSEAFVNHWLFTFLKEKYGADYKKMEPYGIVVLDMPMEYNTSEYSQAPFGDSGIEQQFEEYFPKVYANAQADNFRGDFIALVYRNGSSDTSLAHAFSTAWEENGRPEFEIESYPLPTTDVTTIETDPVLGDFLRSDHTPFWVADFPAIFLTDTANYRGDGAFCYHQPCDNIETMLTEDNINFLGKSADTTAAALHLLSEPQYGNTSGASVHLKGLPTLLILVFCVFFGSQP